MLVTIAMLARRCRPKHIQSTSRIPQTSRLHTRLRTTTHQTAERVLITQHGISSSTIPAYFLHFILRSIQAPRGHLIGVLGRRRVADADQLLPHQGLSLLVVASVRAERGCQTGGHLQNQPNTSTATQYLYLCCFRGGAHRGRGCIHYTSYAFYLGRVLGRGFWGGVCSARFET